MEPPSHIVVLVDGSGGPERGLLLEWGDTSAFLADFTERPEIAWVEARKDFEGVTLRRGAAFVRDRYAIIADRIASFVVVPRRFQWRAHLWAGFDAGGTWTTNDTRLTLVQPKAGLELAVTATVGEPTWIEPPYRRLEAPHVHQLFESEAFAGDHAVADATVVGRAPSFLAVLAPWSTTAATGSDDAPLEVSGVDTGPDAAAWLVYGPDWTDLAWLRGATAATSITLPGGITATGGAALAIVSLDAHFGLNADGARLRVGVLDVFEGKPSRLKVTP